MVDSKMISAIRKIHRTLFNILIFILVFVSFGLIILDHGLQLKSIKSKTFHAQKVYIKWNKKLTLHIDKLSITPVSTSNSKLNNLGVIQELLQVSALFFDAITVDNLQYENKNVSFSYKHGNFSLLMPEIELQASISIHKNRLLASIDRFNIKQFNTSLHGDLVYNHNDEKSYFQGTYFIADEINGTIALRQFKNNVHVTAKSDPFFSLVKLQDVIGYDDNTHKWIALRGKADKFQLETLSWSFNMAYPNKILDALYAKVKAVNLSYLFDPDYPAVTSTSTDIIFKNRELHLHLNRPIYEGRSLDGSHLLFTNLLNNARLDILIHSNSPLDKEIIDILNNYHVTMPLTQLDGLLTTDLELSLNLIGKTKVDANGIFHVEDSNFMYEHFTFFANSADFELRDKILFIKEGNITIEPYLDAMISGQLDTFNETANLYLLLTDLNVTVLGGDLLENRTIPLTVDMHRYYTQRYFYVHELQTTIVYDRDEYQFLLFNLEKFYKYSPLLRFYDIESGFFQLRTKDFLNSSFEGEIYHNSDLFLKNEYPIKNYKFVGKTDKESLEIEINDDINLRIADTLELNVTSVDVNSKAFQKYQGKKSPFSKQIIVNTKNSDIYINDQHKIVSDSIKIDLDQNSSKVDLRHNEGNISIETNASQIRVRGDNLDDDFVKELSGFTNFEDGNFKFTSEGNTTHYTTDITFKDVIVRNLALYNNLMAFINTVPALLTFSQPGFNDKGYLIEKGEVHFRRVDDYIIIDELRLKGVNTNANAVGIINLKDETIDILISLETIKDLAKTIGAIPIAGYIILGDDKTIRTRIKVTGSIKNPKITTKVGQDVLEAPFNIIKRTLKLPKKLLEILQ